MIKREDLENTNNGCIVDFNGSKNLLVSFGGIRHGLGMPVFEFFNSIADIQYDKIFFRDFNQAWYQKGVDSELNHVDEIVQYLKKIIDSNTYENVFFLGNSMGGYAAILFGSILNVDTVISFVPQTFINRFNRIINRDKRWTKEISKIYAFQNNRKAYFDLKKHLKNNNSYKTQINIYYFPSHILDKKHAERLKNQKNVNLHAIEKGVHEVAKIVRNNGELKSLINSKFKNGSSH